MLTKQYLVQYYVGKKHIFTIFNNYKMCVPFHPLYNMIDIVCLVGSVVGLICVCLV